MRVDHPNPSHSADPSESPDRAANYAEAALVLAAACSAVAWCITLLT